MYIFPAALCCWNMEYQSNELQKTLGISVEVLQENFESVLERQNQQQNYQKKVERRRRYTIVDS